MVARGSGGGVISQKRFLAPFHPSLAPFHPSCLGLLLEGVQHVDTPGDLDRVGRAIGVAVVVLHHFEDAGPSKPLQNLGVRDACGPTGPGRARTPSPGEHRPGTTAGPSGSIRSRTTASARRRPCHANFSMVSTSSQCLGGGRAIGDVANGLGTRDPRTCR